MAEESENRIEKAPVAMKTPRKPPTNLIVIEERHRTIRFLGILATIAVCVWKVSDAVVKIMDKPPWLPALTAVISLFVVGAAPSALLAWFVSYIRQWTAKHVARESRLEQLLDFKRTSSGLTNEGTDPKEPENGT